MTNPLVSLIIPVYNVEEYLRRCLHSLVSQDYPSIEIIAVNDGSPDNSIDILNDYAQRYPYIKVISQPNGGLSAARKTGVRHASGEFFCFVDSDDYVELDYVSKMMTAQSLEDADIVTCGFFFNFPSGVKLPYLLFSGKKKLTGIKAGKTTLKLLTMPPFMWNKLYRKSTFLSSGVDMPDCLYEDIASVPRLLAKMNRIALVQKPLYHYCLRRTGICGNFGRRNIHGYLRAVTYIHDFLVEEELWNEWRKEYRTFLRLARAQLFYEITLQKNSIPRHERLHLLRFVHRRIRRLSKPGLSLDL